MKLSLRWQVLWPPAIALFWAVVALFLHRHTQQARENTMVALSRVQNTLEIELNQLRERHRHLVQRATAALFSAEYENREAFLSWTAEHYAQEIDRHSKAVRKAIESTSAPNADERWQADLERLHSQLDRIHEAASRQGQSFAELVRAVQNSDEEAIGVAAQAMNAADRAVDDTLQITGEMVRRMVLWQLGQIAQAPDFARAFSSYLLLAIAVVAMAMALRPLNRIARLARRENPRGPFLSDEEQMLAARLRQSEETAIESEAVLSERVRETERATVASRRAEQELALLRLYNENLMSSLRSAIVVTDQNAKLQSYNRAARLLFQLDDGALDQSLKNLAIGAALMARGYDLHQEMQRAINDKIIARFENLPLPRREREALIDLSIVPFRDESGAARGLLWVADDVTDAVHTKHRLFAAERLAAVGRLSAQIAHEVRNPLSAIALNTELLGDEFVPDLPEKNRAEAAQIVKAISSEIERLTQVTEGYLQLTRIPHPQPAPTDLNQTVNDLVTMLAEELKAAHIKWQLELCTPPAVALVDPGQLRQAILNILRNSREAMTSGGTITIQSKNLNDLCLLEISDDGPGIPAQIQSRVSEPFFSTKAAGTGLGLSLSRQFISENGGTLSIDSAPPHGTRVRIELPAA